MARAKARSKPKSAYVCSECGAEHAKWQGQCAACHEWNTLTRVSIGPVAEAGSVGFAGVQAQVAKLGSVQTEITERLPSGFEELDRVLGGGFVPGSVVLIGGDPGAGKSTLLLQVCARLAQETGVARNGVLYVTGEESLAQLKLRAERLELSADEINVAAETRVETIG